MTFIIKSWLLFFIILQQRLLHQKVTLNPKLALAFILFIGIN